MQKSEERKVTVISKGLLFAFTAGLLLSCSSVIVKYIKNIHPGQLALYRAWGVASVNLPSLIRSKENFFGPPGFRISIAIRSIFAAAALLLKFLAFRYLPIGEATILVSTYPIFVTLAAKFFLKESFGLLQVASLLTTLVGIILMTHVCQPSTEFSRVYTTENMYGFAAALAAVFCCTIVYTVTRKLRCVHSSVVLNNTAIVTIIQCVIVTYTMDDFRLHYKGVQQVLLILLGFLSYFGMSLGIVAMHYVEAGPASTMRTSSEMFLSFVWQICIFHEIPDALTVVGGVFICVSIVLLGLQDRIKFLCNKSLNSCLSWLKK